MQAIILAAGKGERLWPLTRNTPKCLLEIGDGLTLLERQLLSIQQSNQIKEIILVLGYLAEQVDAKLNVFQKIGLNIRTIYNPFFETSNNLISLWLAILTTNSDIVVINGDDVFKLRVLQDVIAESETKDVVMVIDRKDSYDDDDMKLVIKDDTVQKVSKKIPPERANGESIGMITFRRRGVRKLKEALNRLVQSPEGKDIFWLAAVQSIIDEGFPVNFSECAAEDWAEIDFHPDRDFVRDNLQRFGAVANSWLKR